MTLTFLILAGQVKVKGQLGEMAKCLEDEDRRIADLESGKVKGVPLEESLARARKTAGL